VPRRSELRHVPQDILEQRADDLTVTIKLPASYLQADPEEEGILSVTLVGGGPLLCCTDALVWSLTANSNMPLMHTDHMPLYELHLLCALPAAGLLQHWVALSTIGTQCMRMPCSLPVVSVWCYANLAVCWACNTS
jgi:hypothetical protein